MTTNGVNLLEVGLNLDATKHTKGGPSNDDVLANIAANLYLQLANAFCEEQAKAAREDARQTDENIAKGQATAEVVASYNQTQTGQSHGGAHGADASGAIAGNGAAGAVGGAAK